MKGLLLKVKKVIKWFLNYWRFGGWFNPNESFLKLPAFWAPFSIIVIFFGLLCWKVIRDENLVWEGTATLSNWYEWYKIPFWVLALLIPLIGLFNANHKSEQAKTAMELTRSQNNFANYYKHLEEFLKFSKDIENKFNGRISVRGRELHADLFPFADSGDYGVIREQGYVFDGMRVVITMTINEVKKLVANGLNDHETSTAFFKKQLEITRIITPYISVKEGVTPGLFSKEEKFLISYNNFYCNRLNQTILIMSALNQLIKFDPRDNLVAMRCDKDYRNAFIPLLQEPNI